LKYSLRFWTNSLLFLPDLIDLFRVENKKGENLLRSASLPRIGGVGG